jgi:hypothetical protein
VALKWRNQCTAPCTRPGLNMAPAAHLEDGPSTSKTAQAAPERTARVRRDCRQGSPQGRTVFPGKGTGRREHFVASLSEEPKDPACSNGNCASKWRAGTLNTCVAGEGFPCPIFSGQPRGRELFSNFKIAGPSVSPNTNFL